MSESNPEIIVVVEMPPPIVVEVEQPGEVSVTVATAGERGLPGPGAEEFDAIAALLTDHIAATTDVHGIEDAVDLDERTTLAGVSPLQWYLNGKA